MKKSIIFTLTALILSACSTPEYGKEKADDFTYEVSPGIEVLTYNGYVVEVTEDNIVRVKVPKRGDMVQEGLHLNEEGILEVALASIMLPVNEQPLAKEANEILNEMLVNQEVTVDITPQESTKNTPNLDQVMGYITVQNKELDYIIQDVLIENGFAIVDKSKPFIDSYMDELENLQTAAQDNSLGVWAIDGFVRLSDTFEGYFTDITKNNEDQFNQILNEMEKRDWSVESILDDYLQK